MTKDFLGACRDPAPGYQLTPKGEGRLLIPSPLRLEFPFSYSLEAPLTRRTPRIWNRCVTESSTRVNLEHRRSPTLPSIASCVSDIVGPPQAICEDRRYSCSTGSGTCSSHGGVYCWRN